MIDSLIIAVSFISVIPIPQRYIPVWDSQALRYFCPMLAVTGCIFGLFWLGFWSVLCELSGVSQILRGFLMMVMTLGLTGGLHLDGLMDTCDAVFSRRDRETRLRILSDTHAGSFAVMGCAVILLGKTLVFSELLRLNVNPSLIPVYSRLGMAVLLNNLPFAKTGGLAVMLGSARSRKHNVFFAVMMMILFTCSKITGVIFAVSVIFWWRVCMKIFGGISGDLLGFFVEMSEFSAMVCLVISDSV
ncbi:MAG: adenosylcobinamide-GDP ribazoletransferase [Synergistaceae bacterium]|nr:adenosylcobinamide-GDP ribazoletransferase [Synergistaceae bacterium]MBR0035871.1 adenosylcobinamide-GDP ribazoletransferase [Synergistaceae bacterium]